MAAASRVDTFAIIIPPEGNVRPLNTCSPSPPKAARRQVSIRWSSWQRRIERGNGGLALFLDGPGRRPPVKRIRQPFQNGVPPGAHSSAPAVARAEAAMGQREPATVAVRREFEQDRSVQAVDHP